MRKHLWRLAQVVICCGFASVSAPGQEWVSVRLTDLASSPESPEAEDLEPAADGTLHWPASFQEQPPRVIPRTQPAQTQVPSAAMELSAALFGGGLVGQALLSSERRTFPVGIGSDVVMGFEAIPRSTTDAGNLLGKSSSQLGLGVQNRNPIITDPRIRGSRVGGVVQPHPL